MSLLSRLKSTYQKIVTEPIKEARQEAQDAQKVRELLFEYVWDDEIKNVEKKWAEMKPIQKLRRFHAPKFYIALGVFAAIMWTSTVIPSYLLSYKLLCDRKMNGLPWVSAFDVNENFITDSVDMSISNKLLQNKKILSQDYVSSVRMVHSPAVLEKLAEYGINKPVVCVNENTLVVCNDYAVERIIPDVPKDKLHDFVVKPGNPGGLDAILRNKTPHPPGLVYLHSEAKDVYGEGVVLGNGYVATACHVANPQSRGRILVRFENKDFIMADTDSVIAFSKEHDLAVLKLDFDGYLPIAMNDSLQPGSTIYLSREEMNPNRIMGEKEEGTVHSIKQVVFDRLTGNADEICGRDVYLTTLNVYQGDSGSGVFDKEGRLVGIITSASSYKTGVSTVRRTKYLRQMLEYYKEKSE